MRAFQCDICSKLYIPKHRANFTVCDISCVTRKENPESILDNLIPQNCLDLCSDCQNELELFVAGREGSEVK